jgi:hypothetical protein
VRLRRACLPYKPNADHFSGCILDVPVTTHSPLKEGSHIWFSNSLAIYQGRKKHINNGNLAVPALNPAKDFDFGFPSLDGEPSDRRDLGGTLLIDASTAQTSEVP